MGPVARRRRGAAVLVGAKVSNSQDAPRRVLARCPSTGLESGDVAWNVEQHPVDKTHPGRRVRVVHRDREASDPLGWAGPGQVGTDVLPARPLVQGAVRHWFAVL